MIRAVADTFFRWFHELRHEPSHAADFVATAAQAARRQPGNWFLPATGLLLAGPLALAADISIFESEYSIWSLAGRIILVDYLLFFFGWLCGWNAASRWRRTRGLMEELVTTPVQPGVVARMLGAGALSVWSRLLVYTAIVEAVLISLVLAFPMFASHPPHSPAHVLVVCVVAVPAASALAALLAWFHIESLRIAYMMFAVAGLPRLRLGAYAITNFLSINLLVVLLTGLGCMLSGPFGLGISFYFNDTPALPNHEVRIFAGQVGAMICAMLGLFTVGVFKRQTTRSYRREFIRHYLYFTWWGAGETNQPGRYPPDFARMATYLIISMESTGKQPAGTPPPPPPGLKPW